MKKRIILNILVAALLICALAPAALANEAVLTRHIADGTCGEGLSWSLDGYTLTITGSGAMEDGCPWIEHMDHIEHVVLKDGVTKIGKEAFYKFSAAACRRIKYNNKIFNLFGILILKRLYERHVSVHLKTVCVVDIIITVKVKLCNFSVYRKAS